VLRLAGGRGEPNVEQFGPVLMEHFSKAHIVESVPCVTFLFSSRRRHTRSVSAFLLNRSSDLKTSAFTLAFSTSQRLRTTRASARTFFTFRHYITPSARNF